MLRSSLDRRRFFRCLRQRNCIGMVAEHEHRVVGFMIYELQKSKLRILNFATAPDVQRHGVGSQMVRRLIDKLSQQRRSEIMVEVARDQSRRQFFFRSQSFRAVCVLRSHYDDTLRGCVRDAVPAARAEEEWLLPFSPSNRISEFDAAEPLLCLEAGGMLCLRFPGPSCGGAALPEMTNRVCSRRRGRVPRLSTNAVIGRQQTQS